jgi:CHAT domain-containing protein
MHHYKKAVEIWGTELGKTHPYYGIALGSLAMSQQDQMTTLAKSDARRSVLYRAAVQNFQEALDIIPKNQPQHITYLVNLSRLHLSGDDSGQSIKVLKSAEQVYADLADQDKVMYAHVLTGQGNVYGSIGQYDIALPVLRQAYNIRKQYPNPGNSEYAIACINLAQAYRFTNQIDSASRYFLEFATVQRFLFANVYDALSEPEILRYLQQHYEMFDGFLSFVEEHPSQELVKACYNQILFFKGALLENSRILRRYVMQSDANTQQLFADLQAEKRTLLKLYSKPGITQNEIEEQQTIIENCDKEIRKKISFPKNTQGDLDWRDIQKKLTPNTATVEFVRYRYWSNISTDSIRYAALVLRYEDSLPSFIPLFEETHLKKLLVISQVDIMQQLNKLYIPSPKGGMSLYSLIWQPLIEIFKDTKTIYYSPDGLLHEINPAAIAIKWNSFISDAPTCNKFVLLGSTRELLQRDQSKKKPVSMYVYGDIDYGNAKIDRNQQSNCRPWESVAYAQQGVNTICTTVKKTGIDPVVKMRSAAKEEDFKNIGKQYPVPDILHVHTHGYFLSGTSPTLCPLSFSNSVKPLPLLRSGLLLAGANKAWLSPTYLDMADDDGILTADEVSSMRLDGNQVAVLAACHTGLGEAEGHEGVYGLQRAFKLAGTKYIIMSLWEVPNIQTQFLMETFYKNWVVEGMDVSSAFYAARTMARNLYQEPYYWAGFVLLE